MPRVPPTDGNRRSLLGCLTVASDHHSFTLFEVHGPELLMTQIDQWGQEVDRVRVRKGEPAWPPEGDSVLFCGNHPCRDAQRVSLIAELFDVTGPLLGI